MSLPADPASAAVARRFVRDVLDDWDAGEFEDSAVLLTSELVTNALLHARSAPELIVGLAGGRLRIAVSDSMSASPVRKHYGTDAATGRGLLLIETLADQWGTEPDGEGKLVWFELSTDDDPVAGVTAAAAGSLTDEADGGFDERGEPGALTPRRPPGGPKATSRRPRLCAARP